MSEILLTRATKFPDIPEETSDELKEYLRDFQRVVENIAKKSFDTFSTLGIWRDAGDTAALDYDEGDLTLDNTWNDLDISSKIPTGTKAVLIRVQIKDTGVGAQFGLRENGNSNTLNIGYMLSKVAGEFQNNEFWIVPDSNGVIEYVGDIDTNVQITIRGWLE